MSDFPNFTLVIPAAGSGSRLNEDTPKPFISIAGVSILEHTLNVFRDFEELKEVIVCTSNLFEEQTLKILNRLFHKSSKKVVQGGRERQHSIRNALNISDESSELVVIHDAVRPFVSQNSIRKCLEAACENDGAILAVRTKDTIKYVSEESLIIDTPKRRSLWQAQTPQIFKRSVILEAYNMAERQHFTGTDDSSLVEKIGGKVMIVEGERENFKITYPLDLKLAEKLINHEL